MPNEFHFCVAGRSNGQLTLWLKVDGYEAKSTVAVSEVEAVLALFNDGSISHYGIYRRSDGTAYAYARFWSYRCARWNLVKEVTVPP